MTAPIFRLTITLLAFSMTALSALAQTADEDAVRVHIETLFDAMRAADSTAVQNHFHPGAASLYSVSTGDDGAARLQTAEIEAFAAAIGRAEPGLLDEHIGDVEVRIDGDLATAWMPYAFYVGDQFSHCGVNAFHLIRTPEGWRTVHVTDTRRSDDCHPSIAPEE